MATPERLRWRMLLTVEPVMYLYAYGLSMTVPIFQQYIYFRVSEEEGFLYASRGAVGGCSAKNNTNSTLAALENKMSSPQKLSWRMLLTVEPVMYLYGYGLSMIVPIFQQYIYFRISEEEGFPYAASKARLGGCSPMNSTNSTFLADLEKKVQFTASRFDIAYNLCLAIPSIFMSLLAGPWVDTGGRKPALISPITGALIGVLTAITVMYTKWPIYVLLAGAVVNGLCGHFTMITQAIVAYVADTTIQAQVSLRLALMHLMVVTGIVVSLLTSGLWIIRFGFIPPYWFIAACQFTALVYVIFLVPESKPKARDKKDRVPLFSLRNLKILWSVYRDPRHGYRQSLFLLFIGDGIVSLVTIGLSGVTILFVLKSPLCWTPNLVGGFLALAFLSEGFGAVIGICILKKFFSDINTIRIALTSLMASLVWFAFANKTWMVFLVPVVGFLTGAASPVMKGMVAKFVTSSERGAAFSAVSSISTFCDFAGAFLFNSIYMGALTIGFPGLVFIVSAVVVLLMIISMSFVKNPDLFPVYSTTNDVKVKHADDQETDGTEKTRELLANEDKEESLEEINEDDVLVKTRTLKETTI